jgi:hypothetical protein
MAVTVKIKCKDCGGTGLNSCSDYGFAEPRGVAVVCLGCNGTGCATFTYTPFVRRKGRRDIKTVRCSRGANSMLGVGPKGASISYAEFAKGKLPLKGA